MNESDERKRRGMTEGSETSSKKKKKKKKKGKSVDISVESRGRKGRAKGYRPTIRRSRKQDERRERVRRAK